jgi:hypothetical protein
MILVIGPAAMRDSHANGEVPCSVTAHRPAPGLWSAYANGNVGGDRRGSKARDIDPAADLTLRIQLEFHQLERGWERLRVDNPQRRRRLLASLADSGQQAPIVLLVQGQPDRYVVIDGYRRIAALEQLRRDTVETVVVWPMSEGDAVLLDRSLRLCEHETALEHLRATGSALASAEGARPAIRLSLFFGHVNVQRNLRPRLIRL